MVVVDYWSDVWAAVVNCQQAWFWTSLIGSVVPNGVLVKKTEEDVSWMKNTVTQTTTSVGVSWCLRDHVKGNQRRRIFNDAVGRWESNCFTFLQNVVSLLVESWDRLVLSGGGCKVDLPGGRSNPNEDCWSNLYPFGLWSMGLEITQELGEGWFIEMYLFKLV